MTIRNSWLTAPLAVFAAVGVASTAINGVVYLLTREWFSPLVANLIALTVATVLNTEANRRLTFAGAGGSVGRIHCQAFVIFAAYYAITSGAMLVLHAVVAQPVRWLELAVLLTASAAGTVIRFAAMRWWVFSHQPRSRHSARRGRRPTSRVRATPADGGVVRRSATSVTRDVKFSGDVVRPTPPGKSKSH
jgi:putative flippase GtrA